MTLLTTKLDAEPDGLTPLLFELAEDLRERDVLLLNKVSRLRWCCWPWVLGLEERERLKGQSLRAGEVEQSFMARYSEVCGSGTKL